jgi:hypothetical protein
MSGGRSIINNGEESTNAREWNKLSEQIRSWMPPLPRKRGLDKGGYGGNNPVIKKSNHSYPSWQAGCLSQFILDCHLFFHERRNNVGYMCVTRILVLCDDDRYMA